MRASRLPRLVGTTLVVLLVSVGMAYAGGSKESGAAGGKKPVFGLVNINLQALFFNQIADGAMKSGADNNADIVQVNANNDPAKQVDAIETFIQQKVNGIILVAIDVNGILPAVQDAQKAGIPVVAIDAKVKVPPATGFIGVDNSAAGEQSGKFTADYVAKTLGGNASIGIVGALNSYIQNLRKDGFLKPVQGASGIKVVGTVDGQNVQETAMSAAENLVTANPGMNLIYATGEPALIGAIAAVKAGGYADRVKIVGWDLSKQAIEGIDEGFVVAVVQQDPYQEGYSAVQALLKLKAGEKIPEEILIPVTIVTKDNVDKYRAMFK